MPPGEIQSSSSIERASARYYTVVVFAWCISNLPVAVMLCGLIPTWFLLYIARVSVLLYVVVRVPDDVT